MGRERRLHRGPLQRAEVFLAGAHEQVGDGLAGLLLDVGVGVAEGHAEAFGSQATHGGLACAGRADEDQDGTGHRIDRPLR